MEVLGRKIKSKLWYGHSFDSLELDTEDSLLKLAI